MLNINNKTAVKIMGLAILIAVGSSLLFSLLSYVFRDRTEEIRQERYQEQQEIAKELQLKIDLLEKKIGQLKIEKEAATKCMEANSKTGVLVNCETHNPLILIPEAKAQEISEEKIQWLTNKDGQSKKREELPGNTFDEISKNSGISPDYWYDAEKKWKIKKEVALCIAWADSGLGKQLKSTNNIGNVGNNDRGDVVHYKTQQAGVEAIFKVLNNNYLKHKQSIGSLSVGGGGSKPYYATSPDNWDKNTRNCLSVIYGQNISKNFLIRL